jgi:uncharacterized membrane protein
MGRKETDLARQMLRTVEYQALSTSERKKVDEVLRRTQVARNTNQEFSDTRDFGERLSDRIAHFGGSWTFLILFVVILAGWTVVNARILAPRNQAFDPYPFILLNLFLSMLAAAQAPIILMTQNRQAEKDRLDASADYEVNLKSELEIGRLHEKMDELRDERLSRLVQVQEEQMEMLQRILVKLEGTPRSEVRGPRSE